MSITRSSPQEHEQEAESVAPKPAPSLRGAYDDVYKRIQLYWAEARACQEALALHGVEPTQSQFTVELQQLDDQFEERENQLRTLLRHTLRDVRKGMIGIMKETSVESILVSLHQELLREEVSHKENIVTDVMQKIEGYERETKTQLEGLISAHALPIIRALATERTHVLMKQDSGRVLHSDQKTLGLKFVQTLYQVLAKGDPMTLNVRKMIQTVAERFKDLNENARQMSTRTILRWTEGWPLPREPRFHQFIALLKQKNIDKEDIMRIEEAYSNFQAFKSQEEPLTELGAKPLVRRLRSFEERLTELKEFMEHHQNRLPKSSNIEELSLYAWLYQARRKMRDGSLKEEQADALKALGITPLSTGKRSEL